MRNEKWIRAYAATAVVDTVAAGVAARRLRTATKPALMPLLAAAVPGGPRAALAGSWLGDVALLGSGDGALGCGIGGFAGAHLAYLTALRRVRPSGPRSHGEVLSAIGFAAAAVGGVAAIGPRLGERPALRGPIAGYAALVTAMGHAAVAAGIRLRSPALAAGGVLFVVSDGLVALSLFGGRRRPAVDAAVMATYTAAQALLSHRITVASASDV